MSDTISVSSLPKTWILDLDGTILVHNGHKSRDGDEFLNGALEFLHNLPPEDMVVFITSRTEDYATTTEKFLHEHNICYKSIIYNAPFGERILINDCKPSGLMTAIAINTKRNDFPKLKLEVDLNL